MTPAALTLLRQCAARAIVMQSTDARRQAAQELLDETYARFDWAMRGGFAALRATDRGRAELAVVERLATV